jgi:hypothetical protein
LLILSTFSGPKEVSVNDMKQFEKSWNQPFHAEIPKLPVKKRKQFNYGAEESSLGWGVDAHERPPHVPSFLPPFPPKHTFQSTEANRTRHHKDPKVVQQARVKRRNTITDALAAATSPMLTQPESSSFVEPPSIPFKVKPIS